MSSRSNSSFLAFLFFLELIFVPFSLAQAALTSGTQDFTAANSQSSTTSSTPEITNLDGLGLTYRAQASSGSQLQLTVGNATSFGDAATSGLDITMVLDSYDLPTTQISYFSILSADGSEFQIDSMELGSRSGSLMTLTLTGYRDGSSVASSNIDTSNYSAGSSTNGFSAITFDSNWESVDEIRITTSNPSSTLSIGIDDLVISSAAVANANPPVITSNSGGATASVNAAENQTAVTTVTATDADAGASLSYSITGGADQASFSIDTSTGVLTFLTTPNREIKDTYVVTVQVSDGTNTDSQTITVNITDVNDNSPVITSNSGGSTASISVAENVSSVTTVTATDADSSSILTYSISGGTDSGSFSINSSTGALSFISAPDFETKTSYEVTVQVSDTVFTDTQAITVNITDVNDNYPVITSNGGGASGSASVAEGQTAVTTVTATDADAGSSFNYTITGGEDAGSFNINASTGIVTFGTAPDYETKSTYVLVVSVDDGTNQTNQTLTVNITDVNESTPEITSNGGNSSASINVNEGETAVTTVTATDADTGASLSYSIVTGNDGALFSINSTTGVLAFLTAPDYESKASYSLTVRVSDGTYEDTQALSINIQDLNDSFPDITSDGGSATASVSVAENQTAVTSVVATDADSGTTMTYSITGGADAAAFSINSSSGAVTFNTAPDYETKSSYTLVVAASDGTNQTTQTITVSVTDVNDNTPVITSDGAGTTAALNVAENQTSVTTVTATDADAASSLVYSIANGLDGAAFAIGSSSGVLSFISAPDYETKAAYSLTVNVSDGVNQDSQTIAITVTDVNDNTPVVTSNGGNATAALEVAEGQTAVTTVTATDADAGTSIIYGISGGTDATAFNINTNSGVLAFTTAPDFETKSSYQVIVSASDGATAGTQTLTITVTDINDNSPVISSNGGGATATVNVAEGQVAVTTVTATDADANTTLNFSLANSGDAAAFNIGSSTGVLTFKTAPDYETKATYSLTVIVDDGDRQDTQLISITITDENDSSPVFTSIPVTSVIQGQPYNYTAVATDADANTTLSYSLIAAPEFLSINSATGVITGITPTDLTGSPAITIRVSDGINTTDQSFSISVMNDLDQDGIADDVDTDIDGDGIPNDWETQFGLDPYDPSDAALDSDGDGLTNLEEFQGAQNPNADDVVPVVTAPANLTVNSTELFTLVDLGTATAVDTLDGSLTPTASKIGRFKPGRHTIIWTATDAAGNIGTATQLLKVVPQVKFAKNQTVDEAGGPSFNIDVYLNGEAADYPVTVNYTVAGTASSADHNLTSGSLVIQSGLSGQIPVTLVDDGLGDSGETIQLSFASLQNAVAGSRQTHSVRITEANEAPQVSLIANQQGSENISLVNTDDGSVVVTAIVSDPNTQDTHSFNWSSTDSSLIDLDVVNNTFTFDPAGLAEGVYKVAVLVTDSATVPASTRATLRLKVVSSLPTLTSVDDSDNDGISDLDEGFSDDDADGIPDYLDATNISHQVEERAGESNSFIMETNPGLSIRLGNTALSSNANAISVTENAILQTEAVNEDYFDNVGGFFDFDIMSLPEQGQSVDVVIAQFAPVPANAVYRKLMSGGWMNFVEDDMNAIASAPGAEGFCPPPGDASYVAGLNEGDWCVQLTIEDGGPNDADQQADGSVSDPGGVSAPADVTVQTSGGGSFSIWGLCMGLVLLVRRYGAVLLLLLGATQVKAEEVRHYEFGIGVSALDSGNSSDDLNQQLAAKQVNGTATTESDSRFGYMLNFALQLDSHFWIESSYTSLGDVDFTVSGQTSDLDAFLRDVASIHSQTGHGLGFGGRYDYPLNEEFSLMTKAGLLFWQARFDVTIPGLTRHFKESGLDPYFGFGGHIKLKNNLATEVFWQGYWLNGKRVDSVNLTLKKSFQLLP